MKKVCAMWLSALLAVGPACKSEPPNKSSAPAKPTAPAASAAATPTALAALLAAAPAPLAAPPASASIGPAGGSVGSEDARLDVPPGAITGSPATVRIDPGDASTAVLGAIVRPRYAQALAREVKFLRTLRASPDGLRFARPAILTIKVAPGELPPGKTLADVRAVAVSGNEIEDLRPVGIEAGAVRFEVRHFSFLTVAVAMGLLVATLGMAIALRGGSDPIMRNNCASYLDAKNAKVAALAGDKQRFAIDTKSGNIKLDLPLQGKDVDQGSHSRRVDRIIDDPKGDCVNMSVLFGSLLLARGYPVRLVGGTATYVRGTKTYKGFHQWTETVIDGKPYYVDTFEPSQTKLIPLDEATGSLKLERNRMCGKNADGSSVGPGEYDEGWVSAFPPTGGDTEALKAEFFRLRDQHASQPNRKLYLRAKAIQEELSRRGVDTKR